MSVGFWAYFQLRRRVLRRISHAEIINYAGSCLSTFDTWRPADAANNKLASIHFCSHSGNVLSLFAFRAGARQSTGTSTNKYKTGATTTITHSRREPLGNPTQQ